MITKVRGLAFQLTPDTRWRRLEFYSEAELLEWLAIAGDCVHQWVRLDVYEGW